jgi:bacterioferritin-associated ferredoxin
MYICNKNGVNDSLRGALKQGVFARESQEFLFKII